LSDRNAHRDFVTSRPHSARMYDYFLGGKDNYPSDREAAEAAFAVLPYARVSARANRAFMHRAVHELAREGYRQFLDIGTGIPTRPNLHEVAQGVAPESRIVYVDNDPIVLAHAQALMAGTPEGRTAYLEADVTKPETILGAPELAATLDLDKPVALSLNAVLHFVPDERDPYGLLAELLAALPSGSALSLSHITADLDPEGMTKAVAAYRNSGVPAQARSKAEFTRFFAGLELLEPGVVLTHRWRPEVTVPHGDHAAPGTDVQDAEISMWVGVARKP
jgi:hypothetical protein